MGQSPTREEPWLIGTFFRLVPHENIGFIIPDEQLPTPFSQNDEVCFYFSKIQGPPIEVNDIVQFQLNLSSNQSRPEAKCVKQFGWTEPDSSRRSTSRSRSQSEDIGAKSVVRTETASSSGESMDSTSRDMNRFGELRDTWLVGRVVTYKEQARHGFIKPNNPLPSDFARNKDVYFKFSVVRGPSVNKNSNVEFLLNISESDRRDFEKPSAKIVKQLGYDLEDGKPQRNTPQKYEDRMETDSHRGQTDTFGLRSDNRRSRKRKITDAPATFSQNSNDIGYGSPKSLKTEQSYRKSSQRGDFTSKVTGKVVKILNEDRGFIEPMSDLPEGYPTDKDIVFKPKFVENGGLSVKEHDILEFTLGTQNKERPMARSVKVVRFSSRSPSEIGEYLTELKKILDNDQSAQKKINESDMICRALTCEPAWMCIGDVRNMGQLLIELIINILLVLDKKALSMQHAFTTVLSAIANTHFFNPWSGTLHNSIKNHLKDEKVMQPLKELLFFIVNKVPNKSSAIVALLKLLVSKDKTSMEYYLYQVLRKTAQLNSSDIDDLSWEHLPLVPSAEELTCGPLENRSSLQPVRVVGAYDSAEEYMDVYFRLLRADCFESLQKGVRALLNGSLDTRDMNVYHSIKLVGIHLTNQDSGMAVALRVVPLRPVRNWATCSNLMFGNLLCLSLSNSFRDPIWATVVSRNASLLQTRGIIIVELCSENNTMADSAVITQLSHGSGRIIAVESPTYYRAYQPVLKALQNMDPEKVPFQNQLVKVSYSSNQTPDYINRSTTVSSSILYTRTSQSKGDTMYISDAFSGDGSRSNLDGSQFFALTNAMSSQIGIIQGPPGTGKTFIGIKIVDLILSMSTAPAAPILVLTYKNHALDEFLKAILDKHPKSVARIGGGCKDPDLQKCNLSELRRSHDKSQALGKLLAQKYSEADNLRPLVESISKKLDGAFTYNSSTLANWATEDQIVSLLNGCDWTKTNQKVPTEHGSRQITWHDVSDVLDYIDAKCRMNLITFLTASHEDKELADIKNNLCSILDSAMKQWYPHADLVSEVEESLGTYSSINLEFVKVKDHDDFPIKDDLQDEKDIEDMEKERMAATSTKILQNADIIEFQSNRHDKSVPCLISTAKHVISKIPTAKLMNCNNLWELTPHERVMFIQCLLINQVEGPQRDFENCLSQYQQVCVAKNELDNQHSLSILRTKKVIGMTITGASIHQNLLTALQPAIVLVEEAAEVLEPQLLAALGKSVQHLILIGDHMQLRPPVESFTLRKDFKFDVSMMERLIKNRAPYGTLKMQNRMRPEFAMLLKDIYPGLRDNMERVKGNMSPPCLAKSMFFWDHNDPEKGGRSYWNEGEAERAVKLCLFLLQQGYEPKQITILGAYQGQTALIRKKVREAEKTHTNLFPVDCDADVKNKKEVCLQRVAVHTIDLYQGDENDIVIVSLVRSNDKNATGYLKFKNRRCVAQSRAKCGLYFIGNSTTVCSVPHWKDMVSKMSDMGCFGPELTIICPKHPNVTRLRVRKADDITLGSFCKKPCTEMMVCKLHKCDTLCQPNHSHNYCRIRVAFTFDRCGHISEKQCSKPQSELQCQDQCVQPMDCGLHVCGRRCDPPHHHEYCSARVDFTYPRCGHKSTKQCSQRTEDVRACREMVKIYHPYCGHLVDKECHVPDERARCKHPCINVLSCGHVCSNRCGEDCISTENCRECQRIAEEKEKQRLRQEREDIQKCKAQAQKEIQALQKTRPSFTRYDLQPSGPTAGEYKRMEDRVKRYVQPMHNWMPSVKRIEKVHNTQQYEQQLKVQQTMHDPRNHDLLFHGTSARAVNRIIEKGFDLPKRGGMFGRGIYFATDSSKSAQDTYTKGSNMLLICDVLLGKSLTVTSAKPHMHIGILKKDGYDSLYAMRGTHDTGGVINDEYVIYDERQAIVSYVVHYECVEITPNVIKQLSFLNCSGRYEKHILKPKRNLDPTDHLDINFRIAESHFLRLVQDRKNISKTDYKLKSVEYHVNPQLIANFKGQKAKMNVKYPKQKEENFVFAFHGTRRSNIDSIVKHNFDLSMLAANTGNRGAYGAGIYFSEFPEVSIGYGETLLLCMLLPGKSFDLRRNQRRHGCPLEHGYDSHRVQADDKGRGHELVIFNADQILPCYVLNIEQE